jgi:hypothetical protein
VRRKRSRLKEAEKEAKQLDRDDKISEYIEGELHDLQTDVCDRFQITPSEARAKIKEAVE